MTRKVSFMLIAVAVSIPCCIAAVQAASGNTLFPDGMLFPNPFRRPVGPDPSAANVSTPSQPDAATLEESSCPVLTDYLGITDEECEADQASLSLDGPNALLIKSQNGSVMAAGNSGGLALGSTDPGFLTPGAMLMASPDMFEDEVRAFLLLTTPSYSSGHSSAAWLGVSDASGSAQASLIMGHPGDYTDSAFIQMYADEFSLSSPYIALGNGSNAGIAIDEDGNVAIGGDTVNVSNTAGSGLSVDGNGSVIIQLIAP